jgi:hypothetical protein
LRLYYRQDSGSISATEPRASVSGINGTATVKERFPNFSRLLTAFPESKENDSIHQKVLAFLEG